MFQSPKTLGGWNKLLSKTERTQQSAELEWICWLIIKIKEQRERRINL